jgi:tetratricopeptide (TPR) repeat protein
MDWARILAFVTGSVDQELLARTEYLVAENRILKAQLKGPLKLTDAERATLAEIGHRLGRKVLAEVATVARPDTILAWYRKLVARKFDGSEARRSPGRPRINREMEQLIVRMAKENHDWGYDRIVGALANLGHKVCDQTVGNVLQRHGLPPAPERKRTTTRSAFIRAHLALLAGTDFFTAEVLTARGLVTYYVLFFIHLESRRVDIAGITVHPDDDRAIALHREQLEITRHLGDRTGEAAAIANQGRILAMQGDYEQALAQFAKAEHISREIGDRRGLRSCWEGRQISSCVGAT